MNFVRMGKGKDIVFLHGWGCDGSVFLPIARYLPNYTCHLLDLQGFGKSSAPPQSGWGVEDYAESVAEYLRVQDVHPCIVAHSFGCRVGMVLAAKHPELVDRMLLVAPAGLRPFSFRRWWKVFKYKLRKFFAKFKLARPPRNGGSADYQACSHLMKNTFIKVVNQDLSCFAKAVVCPVLIVNGSADTETPISHAKNLNKLISNSALVEIEGGHFVFFQNPALFARTVEYFAEAAE